MVIFPHPVRNGYDELQSGEPRYDPSAHRREAPASDHYSGRSGCSDLRERDSNPTGRSDAACQAWRRNDGGPGGPRVLAPPSPLALVVSAFLVQAALGLALGLAISPASPPSPRTRRAGEDGSRQTDRARAPCAGRTEQAGGTEQSVTAPIKARARQIPSGRRADRQIPQ